VVLTKKVEMGFQRVKLCSNATLARAFEDKSGDFGRWDAPANGLLMCSNSDADNMGHTV
jgi:hypothetical protein